LEKGRGSVEEGLPSEGVVGAGTEVALGLRHLLGAASEIDGKNVRIIAKVAVRMTRSEQGPLTRAILSRL
jgi:hypothetical protein